MVRAHVRRGEEEMGRRAFAYTKEALCTLKMRVDDLHRSFEGMVHLQETQETTTFRLGRQQMSAWDHCIDEATNAVKELLGADILMEESDETFDEIVRDDEDDDEEDDEIS
jgi:hypothetical protein